MTKTDADLTEMPFRCGHEKTPENVVLRGGYKKCRICWNAYQRAYQRKQRRNQGVAPAPAADPSVFRCGHDKTPENSGIGPALSLRCRTCQNARITLANRAKQEIAKELRNAA